MSKTRSAAQILAAAPELQALGRSTARLQELGRTLARLVPPSLGRHSQVAFDGSGGLILFTDNPATASRLRQITPRLLTGFRESGEEVSAIRIRVQVGGEAAPALPIKAKLGPQAARSLAQLADNISHEPLRAALRRLRARATSDGQDEAFEGE